MRGPTPPIDARLVNIDNGDGGCEAFRP